MDKKAARFSNPIKAYVVLVIVFILLLIFLPNNKMIMENYNLTDQEYHELLIIIELPLIFIWFAAFYGYSKLKDYANLIKRTPEGKGFQRIATGTMWLAWGIVLPYIIGLSLNGIANDNPSFHSSSVIISNYLNVLFPLIAFAYIASGANYLLFKEKLRSQTYMIAGIMFLFLILVVMYCFLAFRHLNLQDTYSSINPYYLPVWLVLFTLVIPHIYSWFLGISAALEIHQLSRQVKGVLYRKALGLLAAGLSLVIISSIGLQYLHAVVPRKGHIVIGALLLGVYLIYAFVALGFILISAGANRLKKIEEI